MGFQSIATVCFLYSTLPWYIYGVRHFDVQNSAARDRLPGNSSDFQRVRRFTFFQTFPRSHDDSKEFSPTTSATMATSKLIEECLLALKDRTGSSVIAINKWLLSEKKVSTGIMDFLPVNLASSLAVRFPSRLETSKNGRCSLCTTAHPRLYEHLSNVASTFQ
jgi:hypothetical protein